MGRPFKILCVEDNEALADNLREILDDAGYTVRVAGSCAEALAQPPHAFDLALVDVRLPDGDGIELTARLREATGALIILLTGFATLESAMAAVRAGAWAYLRKPCAPHELLFAIEQATKQIALMREKQELMTRNQVAERLAAIGTLTAGLSHEIKNPLNAASLQLAVLERRIGKLPAQAQPALHEPLRLVRDEISRLNQVLEEFLDFARPRAFVPGPYDLAGLLGRVLDLFTAEAERGGAHIERRFSDLPPVMGEETRLQQAFTNLLLNALQATPSGGVVRVEAEAQGAFVKVAIEDTGPGIPEALRRRIFEPFFTTKASGSGLGLPLVHTIVDQHGGTIEIARGPEGGARVVVSLPLSASVLGAGSGQAAEDLE